MELSIYHDQQPGVSYYYSPLGIYNCGIVNHAHVCENGDVREHMHAYVYHEGVWKKGANNVVSIIIKTLRDLNIMREDSIGGELNIIFDNCSGQNKNNTVLKMLVLLTELGYFKKVNFIFLVVGHTKNAADHLFNALKVEYRKKNLFTMEALVECLNVSDSITAHTPIEADFLDYDTFLNRYYSEFAKKVKQNHIFGCSSTTSKHKNNYNVQLRESNLPEHGIVLHNAIKKGFTGRNKYSKDSKGLKEAIDNRPKDIKNAMSEIKPIVATGINIFKQVEMFAKYRPIIPFAYKCDDLYQKPSQKMFNTVKQEKQKRANLRVELNEMKNKVQRKVDIKMKIDNFAFAK